MRPFCFSSFFFHLNSPFFQFQFRHNLLFLQLNIPCFHFLLSLYKISITVSRLLSSFVALFFLFEAGCFTTISSTFFFLLMIFGSQTVDALMYYNVLFVLHCLKHLHHHLSTQNSHSCRSSVNQILVKFQQTICHWNG